MCFPILGAEGDDLIIDTREGDNSRPRNVGTPTQRDELDEGDDLLPGRIPREGPNDQPTPFDLIPRGPSSPFAVFGPRIGVNSISDIRPGQQGRRVTISDLKIGL